MNTTGFRKKYRLVLFVLACLLLATALIPGAFVGYVRLQEDRTPPFSTEFPVTVDPRTKTITDDANVEAYLHSGASPLSASALVAFSKLTDSFLLLWASLSNFAVDHSLALATQDKVIVIAPGARKEEVATALARTLSWSAEEKKEFLNIDEGTLFPGMYIVGLDASPAVVKAAIEERFTEHVVSRYSPAIQEIVPLETALTIASLIQKETVSTQDMRLVSGIIWNRIFANQKLQLDATLQYAKASKVQGGRWWPPVLPKDKFIDSPYNTYKHQGLPPTPIASPSVAAVVAALNPSKTDCYFYFHDTGATIHCSKDYETHVALLQQFFGTGR